MKKLNKKTIEELSLIYDSLDISQSEVESAINMYNETIYDLNEVLRSVAEDIESYTDDRSEKWQESERADDYEQWRSFFEEEKDEIDEPCFEHGEMDDVPVEVGAN